jgi:tetratricopeptide (TPR) repeat protein
LIRADLYVSAIELANKIIVDGYETGELDALLSDAYRRVDQMQDAYDTLRRATHLEPDRDSYYADLADICRELNKYDVGFKIIEIGLSHVPASSSLYIQRGLLQQAVGHMNESVADLKKAAKLSPGTTLPALALSVVWMQMGNNEQAVSLLREQVRLHDRDFAAWYLLSKALMKSQGANGAVWRECMAALERSIELKSDYAPSRAALGKMLLDAKQTEAAIKELEISVKIDPKNRTGIYQLALAYRRAGDIERAKQLGAMVRNLNAAELEKASLDSSLLRSSRQMEIKKN